MVGVRERVMGGGHGREFEVKLEIPAQTVSRVMRLTWLWELASGELSATHLQSIYYDTPESTLRERGVTLRVRRIGTRRVQTIKAAANGAALPIERDEWEEDIASDEPQLKPLAPPLEGLSRRKLRRRLRPCFEIHVDRSAFPIQSANSAIEIAVDRAHIIGEHALSFCEIELELKRGAASEMARIARRIASEVPAALSLRTKADRGYALLNQTSAQPYASEDICLDPATRVGEAFQHIGWICLRHFALNKDAVQTGDPQAAQEMRAGLRRLLAAIFTFRRLLDGPETDAVTGELEWLITQLDPACDLDDFLQATLEPLREIYRNDGALDVLCSDIVARREAALKAASEAIAGDRYRELVLRTALWLIAAEWSDAVKLTDEEPSHRARLFAAKAIADQTRRLAKLLNKKAAQSPDQLAELHQALRRLQASVEFFDGSLSRPSRERRAFRAFLKRLGRDVGWLVNLAAAERLRGALMQSWTESGADGASSQKAYALGFTLGQHAHERVRRLEALTTASKTLLKHQRRYR